MKITELRLIKYIRLNPARTAVMILAGLSGLICVVSSSLHYTNRFYGNPVSWISWLTGMLFLIAAFFPPVSKIKEKIALIDRKQLGFFISLIVFFLIWHFWNWKTAPWNQNGLFDDAAWNVYFAEKYIFSTFPFQAAFFDVGVSMEVVFHYYIMIFFKLFGHNLLVFNILLIFLGLMTYLFTCLLIQRLFKNYWVTLVAALVLNFFPFHFIHIFEGHRYAMMYPLMMASLYFLYTGFKNKSPFRVVISSVLAALCLDSAIMGKQYLMGLMGAWILWMILDYKRFFNRTNWNLSKLFGASLIIASIPLILYVCYNPIYFLHESDLTNQFLATLRGQGLKGLAPYWQITREVFFSNNTYWRRFNSEFVTIPFAYYLLLLPGFVIAFRKKHYEVIILALLPVAAAFVSECWDFRFLHALPFWIILIAFTVNRIIQYTGFLSKANIGRFLIWGGMAVILLGGLIPGAKYIYSKSKDPNSIRLYPQKDVAVSRYLRDIVAGVPNPSPQIRHQEFLKLQGYPEPHYDTLICQHFGYAITHLFLREYDDQKIMAFSDQMPFDVMNETEILIANIKAIKNYAKSDKDLKLIWEIDGKTNRIIEKFKALNYLGNDEVLSSRHAGSDFSFYILTIKNDRIDELKDRVQGMTL